MSVHKSFCCTSDNGTRQIMQNCITLYHSNESTTHHRFEDNKLCTSMDIKLCPSTPVDSSKNAKFMTVDNFGQTEPAFDSGVFSDDDVEPRGNISKHASSNKKRFTEGDLFQMTRGQKKMRTTTQLSKDDIWVTNNNTRDSSFTGLETGVCSTAEDLDTLEKEIFDQINNFKQSNFRDNKRQCEPTISTGEKDKSYTGIMVDICSSTEELRLNDSVSYTDLHFIDQDRKSHLRRTSSNSSGDSIFIQRGMLDCSSTEELSVIDEVEFDQLNRSIPKVSFQDNEPEICTMSDYDSDGLSEYISSQTQLFSDVDDVLHCEIITEGTDLAYHGKRRSRKTSKGKTAGYEKTKPDIMKSYFSQTIKDELRYKILLRNLDSEEKELEESFPEPEPTISYEAVKRRNEIREKNKQYAKESRDRVRIQRRELKQKHESLLAEQADLRGAISGLHQKLHKISKALTDHSKSCSAAKEDFRHLWSSKSLKAVCDPQLRHLRPTVKKGISLPTHKCRHASI